MSRVRNLARAALVGLGILALSATSAGAHTTQGYANWYVWQGQRYINMYSGGSNGHTGAETAWKWDAPTSLLYRDFGFNFFGLIDWQNNGPNECVEAWMDFSRGGLGNHRNPTVFRHCNTYGNTHAYHSGITDPVRRPNGYHFVGWDFVLCNAFKTGDGKWHRTDCTNELGDKSFAWVDGSSRDDTTDAEVANCGAGSTLFDTRGSSSSDVESQYMLDGLVPGHAFHSG